jgi:hypothetical protein
VPIVFLIDTLIRCGINSYREDEEKKLITPLAHSIVFGMHVTNIFDNVYSENMMRNAFLIFSNCSVEHEYQNEPDDQRLRLVADHTYHHLLGLRHDFAYRLR